MKKKLEADLLSIAHRILQMKNKSDQDQVFAEVQKLYEKLTVMRFVDEHFSEVKPTAGSADIEAEMAKLFDDAEAHEAAHAKENEGDKPNEETKPEVKEDTSDNKGEGDQKEGKDAVETEEKPAGEPKAETAEKELEEEKKEVGDAEEPAEESKEEAPKEAAVSDAEAPSGIEREQTEKPQATENETNAGADVPKHTDEPAKEEDTPDDKKEERKPTQISFDDLMQHHYEEPVFERADAKKEVPFPETVPQPEALEEAAVALGGDEDIKVVEAPKEAAPQEEKRPSSLHEQIGKTITIGLNDRIGFEKNLFGGSAEDMNRVLSQLNTFNSWQEAKDFIEDMVKPDYNNWTGKEDYEQRFLDIVERKFS